MATRLTLAQVRQESQKILGKIKEQADHGLLKPGAYDQVQWVLRQLDNKLSDLKEEQPRGAAASQAE